MACKIILSPRARKDIEQAISYYKENVSLKLAKNFLEDYRKTYREIRRTRYFRIFFDDFRGKPMSKFPYIVFYTIDEATETIIIKAVFQASQDPEKYPQ